VAVIDIHIITDTLLLNSAVHTQLYTIEKDNIKLTMHCIVAQQWFTQQYHS
jgi:hypothetical protein